MPIYVFLSLTLIRLGVSSDHVFEFKAVGSHLLLRLTANCRHVAVLHLTGAAAGPGVDTHPERLIWKTGGKKAVIVSFTVRPNLIQHRTEGGRNVL